MNKWDELAIMTFIACDVLIENTGNLKLYSDYFCRSIRYEAKDIFRKLFK